MCCYWLQQGRNCLNVFPKRNAKKQKTNQKEFRFENVKMKEDDKLGDEWKGYNISFQNQSIQEEEWKFNYIYVIM